MNQFFAYSEGSYSGYIDRNVNDESETVLFFDWTIVGDLTNKSPQILGGLRGNVYLCPQIT